MKTQFFKRTAIALMVCGASATVSLSAMAEVTDEKFNDLKETVDALWGSDNKLKLQDGNILTDLGPTKYNGVGGLYESLDTKIKNIYGDNVKVNANGTFSLKDDKDNTHAERQFNLGSIIKDLDDTNDYLEDTRNTAYNNEARLDKVDKDLENKADKKDLTDLSGKVATLSVYAVSKATQLESATDQNATDIAANKSDINALSNKVDNKVEKTDFNTLSEKVSTNEGRIAAFIQNVNDSLEPKVSENGSNIEKNTANINTNTANIDSNKTEISSLSGKVANLSVYAESKATQLESATDQNATDIATNKASIDSLADKHDVLAKDHMSKMTKVSELIDKHDTAIRAINEVSLKSKASKTYVDEKLDAKADKSALAEKASMDDVLSYHNATLDTLKDASERISKNEDQIAAINARHDKVDAEKQAKIEEELKSLEENLLQERKEEYAMLGAIADNVDEQINTLTDFTLHNFRDFDARLNRLDKQLKRGLAAQAALSGLFQPYTVGKFNATAAVGGYKSQQAVAVGAGYRFNDHVAAKAGVAFAGHGDVSYHAGVNFEW